jgi:hypothetical protein
MTVIELNLRLPSMLHGKKGFDRIIWAFTNVLNQSLAWLFCDLESTSGNQGWFFLLPGIRWGTNANNLKKKLSPFKNTIRRRSILGY